MSKRTFALLLVAGMTLAACGTEVGSKFDTIPPRLDDTSPAAPITTAPPTGTVTLVAHDSFAEGVTDETFAAFTAETGLEVRVLPAGDAGAMVNQAVLTKAAPLGDALFGVDDTFLSRALDAGLFSAYTSANLDDVPAALRLDPGNRVTPIDFGDVCLNYDKTGMGSLAPPTSLDDLTKPEYANKLVVENPATSSPGLAFLLATIDQYGESGWKDYWTSLVANGVKVVADWDTAYYTDFTRNGGDRPLVVSYATSPPAEVIFADPPVDEAPTGVVDAGCYRQIEFAGVLAGAPNAAGARDLIDFMLTPRFQSQVPLTWFVFPANPNVALPTEFVDYATLPENPASVDPGEIDANREKWIEEWTQIVLP